TRAWSLTIHFYPLTACMCQLGVRNVGSSPPRTFNLNAQQLRPRLCKKLIRELAKGNDCLCYEKL
ncbi:hypothetical protein QUB05_30545, partial [Microcoleus sp. F10-C6]|uniref:hypothetical protein n=1 Tax=unclassified Microcoleus TaxID=2642155 RepID=UPI002FD79AF1